MFKRVATVAIVACLLGWMPAPLSAGEPDGEIAIDQMKQQVHFLWQQRDFAQLEAWATDFRDNKKLWPSGSPKLNAFYSGFGKSFTRKEYLAPMRTMWAQAYADWVKAYPNSPTPHIANAQTLHSEAWTYRGIGFARDVWGEDMKVFSQREKVAKIALLQHKAVASNDPYFYLLAAAIGRSVGEPRKEYFGRLEEGIKKHPDYNSIHYEAAIYLSPNWGGSAREFVAWADRSAARAKSIDGRAMYVRMYYEHRGEDFAKELMATSESHREKIRQGITANLAHYPTWTNVVKMLSMACALRDAKEAEKIHVVWRKLDNGNLPPEVSDVAKYCRWPAERVVDPAVKMPPAPGADPGVQKAKAP